MFYSALKQTRRLKKRSPERGAVLILSIMILASISIISFSLSSLVLRQIKSARTLVKSEPSISLAESGGETALYFRIRGLDTQPIATASCPATVTEDLSSGQYDVCNDFYDNPYNFSTTATDPEVVILNNPIDLDDPAAGYSAITISFASGNASQLKVEAYDIYSSDGFDEADCGVNPKCITIVVGGSGTLAGLNPNTSYAVFLKPLGGSTATAVGTIVNSGGGPPGIPSLAPSINSTGSTGNVNRKIEIFFGQ